MLTLFTSFQIIILSYDRGTVEVKTDGVARNIALAMTVLLVLYCLIVIRRV